MEKEEKSHFWGERNRFRHDGDNGSSGACFQATATCEPEQLAVLQPDLRRPISECVFAPRARPKGPCTPGLCVQTVHICDQNLVLAPSVLACCAYHRLWAYAHPRHRQTARASWRAPLRLGKPPEASRLLSRPTPCRCPPRLVGLRSGARAWRFFSLRSKRWRIRCSGRR